MDYEKKYKEALEKARQFSEKPYLEDSAGIVEYIFPELKESEDERIRKAIIQFFELQDDNTTYSFIPKKDILAWLEKQGETFTKKDVDDAYLKGISDAKNEIEKQYEANYQIRKDIATFIFNYRGDIKDRAKWMDYLGIKVSFVEKQGEQKTVDNVEPKDYSSIDPHFFKTTDKVEPKFKVGDIISNGKVIYRIDGITKNCIGQDCYFLVNVESEEKGIRYLLMSDSKGNTSHFGETTWLCEQVDKSFEKQGEQKPKKVSLWKHWKDGIIGNGDGEPIFLIKIGGTYNLGSCLSSECDCIKLSELDSLMSEKQGKQPYWKPSEEQLQTLHAQLNEGAVTYPEDKRILFTLYEDLMKIMTQEEKQGEQKSADKVEPKFKICDWVVHDMSDGRKVIRQIIGMTDKSYILDGEGSNTFYFNDLENDYHLWTIQDAKDGDVLEFADHGRLVIGIVSHVNKVTGKVDVNCLLEDNNFKLGNYYALDTIKPQPATKEQRDLLFQKMKESGYEWDTEKKELKKIEL